MENYVLLGVFVRELCPCKDHRKADAPATFSFFSCQMERPFAPHPYGKCRIKKARYPKRWPIRIPHVDPLPKVA